MTTFFLTETKFHVSKYNSKNGKYTDLCQYCFTTCYWRNVILIYLLFTKTVIFRHYHVCQSANSFSIYLLKSFILLFRCFLIEIFSFFLNLKHTSANLPCRQLTIGRTGPYQLLQAKETNHMQMFFIVVKSVFAIIFIPDLIFNSFVKPSI